MDHLVNRIVKYSLEYSTEKYGEVLQQTSTHLMCQELIRAEDIKGGRPLYCGDREFFRGPNQFEIPVKSIKSSYEICSLQEYHSSKGFLLRQTYDPISNSFSPQLTKVCLCKEYLNPDLNFFTCNVCGVIYHNSCVGESCPDCKLPIKRQKSDFELESPKLSKTNSRQDNSLPLDVEKYKTLSVESKNKLNGLIRNVHLNYLAMQGSLNHEEKTREQIICKIKCTLLLAAEEIKQTENIEFSMNVIETLAISVEAAIYFTTGSKVTSQEYSKRMRSITFNLSAEKNPDFRGNLLRGYIDPKDLCKMQSKDMASSEIKNFRQERQKVYTKEQLILPNSNEKLMIKTHKGEAVFDANHKVISDEFSTDILDTISKKRDGENKQENDEDPFNPNNYETIEVNIAETMDSFLYETVKEWTCQAVMNKIRDRITQHLDPAQTSRILARINTFSLNKNN